MKRLTSVVVLFLLNGVILTAGSEEPPEQPSEPGHGVPEEDRASLQDPFFSEQLPRPRKYTHDQFFKDLILDQKAIWTSPFSLERKDAKWVLPVGLAAGALMAFDQKVSEGVRGRDGESLGLKISNSGGPTNFGAAAAVYAFGALTERPKLRETGLLGVRAVSSTWFTVQVIKHATNRERPKRLDSFQEGDFWSGGKSFPSGHAASTWAWATVIAEQYPEKKWVRWGAYAFATAVSVSRVPAQKHFPSDVVIGSVIGHFIGRYVVKSWQRKSRQEILLLQRD